MTKKQQNEDHPWGQFCLIFKAVQSQSFFRGNNSHSTTVELARRVGCSSPCSVVAAIIGSVPGVQEM